jgi:Gas vesicle synthesis protein GvpL/GvpF.
MAESVSDSPTTVSDGRYLYCLVDVAETNHPTLDTTGIGEAPVSVLTTDGIGAVVHPTETLYDSADSDQVRRWLVSHQRVIDDAAAAFGTPVPFQFDVVIENGDKGVTDWLVDNAPTITEALDRYSGLREYRIHVTWDRTTAANKASEDDEKLAAIEQRRAESSDGEQFLLDKQYDQRLETVLREQKTQFRDQLTATVEEAVDELIEHSPAPSVEDLSSRETADEWVARIAVLMSESSETTVGETLDEFATEPGVEIRFTGPWPPYSFSTEFFEGAQ